MGWRVGVYWRDDGAFYGAACAGYEPGSGRHLLAYEDGERELLALRAEAIKWLAPPLPVRVSLIMTAMRCSPLLCSSAD